MGSEPGAAPGEGTRSWRGSKPVVHTPTPVFASRQGRLGSQDEELVLDASPVSESLGAALEQQRQGPRREAQAGGASCSPVSRTCVLCHSRVIWFAGGSAVSFLN